MAAASLADAAASASATCYQVPVASYALLVTRSLALTVKAGEVAEAQAPKLRQQLELQIRRGRNCQTTGGRIVRKH